MLAFGRGVFTATVVSTFILLLISFYPNSINDAFVLNQTANTTAIQTSNVHNIEAEKILTLCEKLDLNISIDKISLESYQALEIQYSIDFDSGDYGLFDSYTLSQELFNLYGQLNKINYMIYADNKPILMATTNKYSSTAIDNSTHKTINEIQKTFSITMLNN